MKKKFLLLFIIPFLSFAQFEKRIDSLNSIIISKIDATKKVDTYRKLIEIYLSSDVDMAQKKINELYRLNKNNQCVKCEIVADYMQANYLAYTNGDPKKIDLYYDKCIEKAIASKDHDYYCIATGRKLNDYLTYNEIEKAEKGIEKAVNYCKKVNYHEHDDTFYVIQATIYQNKDYYNLAIENYLKADKFCNDNNIKDYAFRTDLINSIAMIYLDMNNFKKARQYSNIGIQLSKKSLDPMSTINTVYRRGVIEYNAKNNKNSLSYLLKAYKTCDSINNTPYKCAIALFIGKNYQELNDLPKASLYTEMALKQFEELKNVPFWSGSLINNALINIKKSNFSAAKKELEQAKSMLKEVKGTLEYLPLIDAEIELSKKSNDINNVVKLIGVRDSIKAIMDEKTNLNSLNEFEAKYQAEKKEQQIKLLSTQNELAQKQKYIYISLLGLLALIGGSLFYGYRNKIKTAQKLNELNELKSRFFANISHEFRTPLTLIKSPVQSLQNEISDTNQKNKLQLIDTNSTRMLQLVDQLLELSKIDSGNLKLILKDGNISSFLTSIIEPFQFQSKEKGIQFASNIQKSTENNAFDKDVIEKIVTNLVSNAFKYSPENEQISFSSSVENSNLKLVVSNTGSDVKKEDLPKLFERFYQKNETQQGVGIGLALVKELVDLYKGTIATTLENGELSFIVNLPLAIANENAVVIPSKETTSTIENSATSETELPILLIVDDNAEIRSVVKDIFKNDYQILEAQDGEEGLKLAQNQIPDCIISDVMMPKMDGFEFTKQIKNNELTSFIPVLLLTAKTSDEAHLEGLKSTADAFLTKPFNNDIVKATVQQLIAERKKLHERYSQELVLKPVDIVINSVEEKFIERLQTILDKNLSNSEYTAEDFASEIGMSRMQLHRKLKSLLGVSATEFLRNERLKVGAELLQKGNGNISEIAYSIGFSDVSYFSKCFKEMYHCTPTEYMENN